MFEKSRSIEDVQQLRLLVLLDETVRDKGIMQAAQDLNVDHRTLAASLESGKLSRRMRGALEKALLEGGGSPAREQRERNDELEGRVERLEGQVDGMGKEMNQGLTAVQGEVRALREAHDRGMRRWPGWKLERGVEDGEEEDNGFRQRRGGTGRVGQRRAGAHRPGSGASFPELVTLTRRTDDEAVFGEAWGLIQEWRRLKETHPSRGRGLDWLRALKNGCCRWSWPCWRTTG